MNLRPMRTVPWGSHTGEWTGAAWDRLYEDANARLLERLKKYDAPTPSRAPVQDIVIVYRLPYDYNAANPGSVLYIPETVSVPEPPYSVGIYLCAGPEAADVLESHGVLPGDLVTFARFDGEEAIDGRVQEAIDAAARNHTQVTEAQVRSIRDEEVGKKKLLKLNVPSIHESKDLFERLYGPQPSMEMVRTLNPKGDVVHLIVPTR